MLKDNRGFSLVELLAVLLILVLIGLIAIPGVTKLLDESKEDLYQVQINTIKEGAKNWVADHPRDLPERDGEKVFISLGQLKIGSYVDALITDPITDKFFDTETRVIITKNNSKYTYEVIVDEDKSGEEERNQNIKFPSITYNGNLVTYINRGDTYIDEGLTINGEMCLENNCNVTGYYVTFIIVPNNVGAGIDTNNIGNYYVEYIITDTQTGRDLALFRTVIVR